MIIIVSEQIKLLAKTIVEYSINVEPDEKVLIMYYTDDSLEMVKELVKKIIENKGIPMYKRMDKELDATFT